MSLNRTPRVLVVFLAATSFAVVFWLVLSESGIRNLARKGADAPRESSVILGRAPSHLPIQREHAEQEPAVLMGGISESPNSDLPFSSSEVTFPTFPEARLHVIADSFSTTSPDVGGLVEVAELLAKSVEMVPDSLAVNEATGAFSGKLQLGGLTGTFAARPGGAYAIDLLGVDRSRSLRRQITIELTEQDGGFKVGNFALQSFPEKQAGSTDQLETRITGWRTNIDAQNRAQGFRRTTEIQNHASSPRYLFETTEAAESVEFSPVNGHNAFELWRSRLREFRQP